MERGSLFLIPTTLGNVDPAQTIPLGVREAIEKIDELIAEDERTALRFLGRLGVIRTPEELPIRLLTKETLPAEMGGYLDGAERGRNVGILAEAGCPAIADPGADVVRIAHERGIRVVPLAGPTSVILALMASGFNGQSFTFHGYLPAERKGRIEALRDIESEAYSRDRTQIFIEAPHRNDHLLSDILGICRPTTRLCVAVDLTLPAETIRSTTIRRWKEAPFAIGKRPAIFLLYR